MHRLALPTRGALKASLAEAAEHTLECSIGFEGCSYDHLRWEDHPRSTGDPSTRHALGMLTESPVARLHCCRPLRLSAERHPDTLGAAGAQRVTHLDMRLPLNAGHHCGANST
mmetsp:Transcript_138254/g.244079  ORF Transcript_138254/g.244079 Transcript_138254/m.244079 type:complete len:113 (+) Transcript_138254:2634-2972(+)